MNKQNDVEVYISGRVYNMAGYESAEYMQKIATYINAKNAELSHQEGYHARSDAEKNVLMQINLADDYFKLKKSLEETAVESEGKSREIAELKRENITLQTKLDSAEQESRLIREENLEMQKKMIRLEAEMEELRKHR